MRAALAPVLLALIWLPQAPHSGDTVTFTADPPAANVAWDLDGDGRFEATGASATARWTTPGVRTVAARLPHGKPVRRQVEVLNAPPIASFLWGPATPLAGTQVSFGSLSTDPDGGSLELQQAWDLDGDGVFGEATGSTVTTSFAAGDHVVRLRVVDALGAATVSEQIIHVAAPLPPSLVAASSANARPLDPFPVVRLRGRITRRGVRVSVLTVTGPRGARVTVRCHGGGCPRGRVSRAVPARGRRVVSLPRLRRLLRPGARLEVRVTAAGRVGKYTRFLIPRPGEPLRSARCLSRGSESPRPC